MELKIQIKKDAKELSKEIKNLLLIYDHIRTSNKNIDEFNPSKIVLTKDIKQKDLKDVFNDYKNKPYQNSHKLNNKTVYFLELMKKIFSYSFIPHLTDIQLLITYNLVYAYHIYTSEIDKEKFKKSLNLYLVSTVNNYSDYLSILKYIGSLNEDSEENTDVQFLNLCKVIQLLNKSEFNSSLSSFILLNDSIPQYKKINFPKLDVKEDEKTYDKKIKHIAILLDVINSSLEMHQENIRYEIFKKYKNQEDKLNAVNLVLSSLNKNKLQSLSENDLEQNIQLQIEDNKYLKNENDKRNKRIDALQKELNTYIDEVQTLNGEVSVLNGKVKTLSQKLNEEKKNTSDLTLKLEEKDKNLVKLHDELQNIKYRDVCSYIIDYFVCLLNDYEYNIAINSTYGSAVDYVLKEIKKTKYYKYNDAINKKGITIEKLLDFLLDHKLDMNSIVHDGERKEQEFIRLIKDKKGSDMSEQFKSLFNETPLLRQFCFVKENGITRQQIQTAILEL